MDTLYSLGLRALIAAMAGDLIVSLLLPLFYKGYSCLKMSISALGNPSSPVRIPFNIWMLIEGLLFLTALPALYHYYHPVSGGVTVTLMIFTAVFAVGACIFTCFFSVNETKDVVTAASKIHGAGSVIGFMLFLFAPLLTAILSFKGGETALGVLGAVCFAAALVFFALFVMSDKESFAGTVISCEGLWQRFCLFFMYLPLIAAAVKLTADNNGV
ncbi:MAG: DUF998 domain-containing protein [Ruminococcus sp.]|nr:DUF998 domain-containing protein [Ruminococcus sp.]